MSFADASPSDQTAMDIPTLPGAGSPPARIIVGIDGSWPARAALRWAARQAHATRSVLNAVRVLDWPVGFHNPDPRRPPPSLHVPDSEVGQSYRDGMRRIFDEVDPLPEWTLTYAEGPTAATLVQIAEDADLLVIGSRERAFAGDARVGDTGHYCTSHSRAPVVIVPVEYLQRWSPPPLDP